jgi:hypothetical protein
MMVRWKDKRERDDADGRGGRRRYEWQDERRYEPGPNAQARVTLMERLHELYGERTLVSIRASTLGKRRCFLVKLRGRDKHDRPRLLHVRAAKQWSSNPSDGLRGGHAIPSEFGTQAMLGSRGDGANQPRHAGRCSSRPERGNRSVWPTQKGYEMLDS